MLATPMHRGWDTPSLQQGYLLTVDSTTSCLRILSWWLNSPWPNKWSDQVIWNILVWPLLSSTGKSERLNPINQLVMSSPSINVIFPTIFFKSFLHQYQYPNPILSQRCRGWETIKLRQPYLKPFKFCANEWKLTH